MNDWITLSNLLPQLVYPLNLALWFLILGMGLLSFRRHRAATFSLVLGVVIVGVSSSPISVILYNNHERTYLPVPTDDSPSAGAIVLLSGDIGIPLPPRVESQLGGNRVLHAFRLYRAGKAKLIVASGGNVFHQSRVKAEAVYISDILKEWGVPESAILVERHSRNTHENALETQKILNEHQIDRILLVTDAFHMPRAFSTFQRTGLEVVASPSGYRVAEYQKPVLLDWWPSVTKLHLAHLLMHEKLGILVYRLRGWID